MKKATLIISIYYIRKVSVTNKHHTIEVYNTRNLNVLYNQSKNITKNTNKDYVRFFRKKSFFGEQNMVYYIWTIKILLSEGIYYGKH